MPFSFFSQRLLQLRSTPRLRLQIQGRMFSSNQFPGTIAMNNKIVIIGTGNMAKWIITGLLNKEWLPENIVLASPNTKEVNILFKGKNIALPVVSDNNFAVSQGKMIILACKPIHAQEVLKDISNSLSGKLLFSVLAGVRISTMNKMLGHESADIVRTMPNAGSAKGLGAGGFYANPALNFSPESQIFKDIIDAIGCNVQLDEERKLNPVTATSGSGVAYVFLLIECLLKSYKACDSNKDEALQKLVSSFNSDLVNVHPITVSIIETIKSSMIESAQQLGLEKSQAIYLVEKTFKGGLSLFLEQLNTNPERANGEVDAAKTAEVLKNKVTSPGGTTAAALYSFEIQNFADFILQIINSKKLELATAQKETCARIVNNAMASANNRSQDMGDEAEEKVENSLESSKINRA
ncbi:MAG: pyrroline-5-carboxylate reductase dimerization domain-containing protein [Legionellaceae bacterium]|nr:pyrroline-5-carboxylate reductase dimerization domain-containing protein [Legionellaceae bacterium]